MTVADFEKGLACLLSWREERSNKQNGMLAVLFVVRNRAKAGWGQGSWTKVIEQHNQFSSMTVLGDGQTVVYPDPRDPDFLAIMQLVDSVYDDTRVDNLTLGSLYYADLGSPAYNKGGWFDRNIAGDSVNHPRQAQVGTTTFYK